MDEYLQSVGLNQVGQLYIGGYGLFHRYLNRPDLTEKVLVQLSHLTDDDAKYYKTGDLVKLNEKGEIIFVGRQDFQVKLRGQRIELEEIERVVLRSRSDAIQNCLVTKFTEETTEQEYLIAYIQSLSSAAETTESKLESEIREYCQRYLLQYMCPSIYIVLKQFPMNQNVDDIHDDTSHLTPPTTNESSDNDYTGHNVGVFLRTYDPEFMKKAVNYYGEADSDGKRKCS
ncbi:unnamed protein product [Didymodactylos carnosus]|uniref:Uncharacterized protein n=1 Tax=Didymodactylos carnosus TaxID=1234261 RepID=A0A814GP15_9BILA|nr:unnamed protein product [Didymodactylos carnosus]CAF1255229.1 unnamed protein product [Didymodactylos carnosus]CAF3770548.1 unnamed protein product [Didymodactylos carnosus]CAF4062242.1 unnamed protein product [Didymodactylos carnosus]